MTRRRHIATPPPSQRREPSLERLQKVLAAAGMGSRRECELLILEGRVEVDRQVVDELGSRVDASCQEIRVDGEILTQPRLVYFAVNKPTGVVCTNRDPAGRPRVIDLIRADERLFTVGRLDRTSEGLILVTNDGELANWLTHPRYGVEKVYRISVAGHPTAQLLRKLTEGVHLAEGVARVVSVRLRRRHRDTSELEIVLDEGRNREIRRLLARIGHKVLRLKRVAIGPLQLGNVPVGAHRRLHLGEVRALREACRRKHRRGDRPTGQAPRTARSPGRGPRPAQRRPASPESYPASLSDQLDPPASSPAKARKTSGKRPRRPRKQR